MDPSFFRSSKGRLLFSVRGRISRTEFWVGLAVILGITTLAVLIGGHRSGVRGLGEFFALIALIAMASPYCFAAIVIKRLHDIDRSGWWTLTLLIPLLLGAVALIAYAGLREEGRIVEEWKAFWTNALYVTAALAIGALGALITKLGFTRGTADSNRYGSDPLSLAP